MKIYEKPNIKSKKYNVVNRVNQLSDTPDKLNQYGEQIGVILNS